MKKKRTTRSEVVMGYWRGWVVATRSGKVGRGWRRCVSVKGPRGAEERKTEEKKKKSPLDICSG